MSAAVDYTQVNFRRLDDAITYAVEHPDEFDIGLWYARNSCGTTACVAGTMAQQAGWTPVWLVGSNLAEDVEKDGTRRYVWDVAAELIGIPPDTADDLFVYAGDLEGAISVRNHWARCAGVPERTWDVPEVLR